MIAICHVFSMSKVCSKTTVNGSYWTSDTFKSRFWRQFV